MSLWSRIFGAPKPKPIATVVAKSDPEFQRKQSAAVADLVKELMRVERTSYEIRRELAGEILALVNEHR